MNQKTEILPINPYLFTFKSEADGIVDEPGERRIGFFYTNFANEPNEAHRTELKELIAKEKEKIKGDFNLISFYVYKKTDVLNNSFKGDKTLLRSHKKDLRVYVRWVKEKMDTFFIIEDNNVVYDLIENKKVSPPYEFE